MVPRKVLITGGTGFVGANLARRLLYDSAEVHLLVRPESRDWRLQNVRNDLHWHAAALHDSDAVSRILCAIRPDAVYHLAVHGAYSTQRDLATMTQTNLLGTQALLDAARAVGVGLFVNTGSSSEYGFQDHPPAEVDPLHPNSHYAITKLAATHLCRLAARDAPFPIPTLRLYSVYGAYEEPMRLMPTLINHARRGTLPPLVNPEIERDFVHIDDVVDAYLAVTRKAESLKEPGRVFNVCSGRGVKLRELVECARRLFGIVEEPAWGSMPDRAWDATTWVGNPDRIQTELGWQATRSLEEGLAGMFHDRIGTAEQEETFHPD